MSIKKTIYLLKQVKLLHRDSPNKHMTKSNKDALSPLPNQPDIQAIGPNWTWEIQIWQQPDSFIRSDVGVSVNESPRNDLKAINGSFCSKFHTRLRNHLKDGEKEISHILFIRGDVFVLHCKLILLNYVTKSSVCLPLTSAEG